MSDQNLDLSKFEFAELRNDTDFIAKSTNLSNVR